MVQVPVAVPALALMARMSVLADRRFRRWQRLPMQWSFDGSVN